MTTRSDAASDVGVAVVVVVDASLDASASVVNRPDAAEDLASLFENGVSLLEAAGLIVHANLGDCKAMGERLEEYQHTHEDAVSRVEALYDPARTPERKAMASRFRARFRAAWANVRPGILKCKDTPKVKHVLHRVWGDDDDAGPPPPPE